MTTKQTMSVLNEEKVTYTFEEVYAIEYVRDSIESVLEQTIRQFPMLKDYKKDLEQEILIHLNNEIQKYNNRASINVFCRVCIGTGLKKARRKYLKKSNLLLYYAVPAHELESGIDNDIPKSKDMKEYEQYAHNNVDDYFVKKDFLSILETCSLETQQVGKLLLEEFSYRKIGKILNIPESTIRYKHLIELKKCFSKEFCDFFQKSSLI